MDPKDPSMLHSEEEVEMSIAHLYHLAHDPYNEVTPSIEELVALKDEHGWDHIIEAVVKIYKRPDTPQEEVVEEVPSEESQILSGPLEEPTE
jgi:hypothetical protein